MKVLIMIFEHLLHIMRIKNIEKITDKKLSDIDFGENKIDQLKVRIILRKYLSKIIFRIGFARFYLRLMSVNIYIKNID